MGDGSYESEFAKLMKNLADGMTRNVSAEVIGKGIWSNIISDLYSNIANGMLSEIERFFLRR